MTCLRCQQDNPNHARFESMGQEPIVTETRVRIPLMG
jgi:hypothetical protein